MAIQMFGGFWIILIILAAIGFFFARRVTKVLVGSLLLMGCVPLIIFSNLYIVHYYYWVAITVFFTSAVAVSLQSLIINGIPAIRAFIPISAFSRFEVRHLSKLSASFILGLVAVGNLYVIKDFFYGSEGFGHLYRDSAMAIAEITNEEEVVLGITGDWDPAMQYYADRYFMMAFPPSTMLQLADQNDITPAAVVVCGNERESTTFYLETAPLQNSEWVRVAQNWWCDVYSSK